MIDFLVKKTIKNPDDTESLATRTAYGMFAGVLGIICNIFLFTVKLIVGVFTHSMSVIADAFNNLSDAASSIISVVGSKLAGKPADKDHPFGHGRLEYIAALIVSFLIIEVGINFFKSSIEKIRQPQPLVFTWVSLAFLILSVLVKLWMFYYNRKLGKRIESSVMKATAMDSLFDAITTTVTIASLLIYYFAGINIDGYAGLAVSIIVIYAGIGVIRDTISPLIGEEVDSEMYERVEKIVKEQPKVLATHDLVIHRYGPGRSMATIHVEVSRKMNIEEAHAVADAAESEVRRQTGIALVAHVDPVAIDDARVRKLHDQVERILQILDETLTFHDFHAVFDQENGKEKITVKFDLMVPYSYTKEQEAKVVAQIEAFLREMNSACVCEILVDRGFVIED